MADLNVAFGAQSANPFSVQIEQAGFASQGSWPDAQIQATASLVWYYRNSSASRSCTPLPTASPSAATTAQRGHDDCGPNYPPAKVLQLASQM